MKKKIIKKLINPKNILFFFIIVIILHNFKFAKNINFLVKDNFHNRLVKNYDYCRNESIGFLNYVKEKYNINNSIMIKNYFISPDPSWFFFKQSSKKNDQKKMILLGFTDFQEINFKKVENYFLSTDIKKLNELNKITFKIKKEKEDQQLSFVIYQKLYGHKKMIYKSNLINIDNGVNTININFKILDSFSNSKIIIEFKNENFFDYQKITDLSLSIKNDINLSEHSIYEKQGNCYLISKND